MYALCEPLETRKCFFLEMFKFLRNKGICYVTTYFERSIYKSILKKVSSVQVS